MGLRAHFTIMDLGMPESTSIMGVFPDYSAGTDIFINTFKSVAQDLCPVDTGNLQGSIEAYGGGDDIECITYCEYAQYVEYGTYKMSAQPYFEPAIAAAYAEATPFWQDAYSIALEEEQQLLEELEELSGHTQGGNRWQQNAMQQQMFARSGGAAMGFGGFLGMVIGAAIAGIIQGIVNIISSELGGRSSGGSLRGGGEDAMIFNNIDVEIF